MSDFVTGVLTGVAGAVVWFGALAFVLGALRKKSPPVVGRESPGWTGTQTTPDKLFHFENGYLKSWEPNPKWKTNDIPFTAPSGTRTMWDD